MRKSKMMNKEEHKEGDRVVKNPEEWIETSYDKKGRGVGVGTVRGVFYDSDGFQYVDVEWDNGFSMEYSTNLIPYREE